MITVTIVISVFIGDILLELNGKQIRYLETVKYAFSTKNPQTLRVKYIPTSKITERIELNKTKLSHSSSQFSFNDWNSLKLNKAKMFYKMV